MSAAAEKPKRYRIEWRIVGTFTLNASSAEEAKLLFDKLSAEELLSDGYDDIEVYEPEEVKDPQKAR